MHISSAAFPKYATQIMSLKRIWAGLVAIALFIGLISFFDALYTKWSFGSSSLRVVAGSSVNISDSIKVGENISNPTIIIRPRNPEITSSGLSFSAEQTTDNSFSFTISTSRQASLGSYVVAVIFDKNQLSGHSREYSLKVYASTSDMYSDSPSIIEQLFEVSPTDLAAKSFFLSFLLALFYSSGIKLIESYIIRRGFCRIQNTFIHGDDTLLYCTLPSHFQTDSTTFPVISASGELLGLATLSELGYRYGVFRLSSAPASVGCYVFLKETD